MKSCIFASQFGLFKIGTLGLKAYAGNYRYFVSFIEFLFISY